MARLLRLLDDNRLAKVLRRPRDNLPDCVKGQVEWRTDHSLGPGYYVLHPKNNRYYPVEFIEDHWYKLRVYTGDAHTTRDLQIPLYQNSTGYWDITDWQHPDNTSYKEELQIYYRLAAEEVYNWYPVRIETADKEAEECSCQDPPTLRLNIEGVLSLAQDPSLSPFAALTGQTGLTESPSLTEPQQPRQQSSNSTLAYEEESPEGAELAQEGQEDPVLEAQFEHILRCSRKRTRRPRRTRPTSVPPSSWIHRTTRIPYSSTTTAYPTSSNHGRSSTSSQYRMTLRSCTQYVHWRS